MNNVLYLGMADDILSPFMLVPNLDNIYVINKFDHCFAKDGTWEGMKEDIKTNLTNGNDSKSDRRPVFLKEDPDEPIHYIAHAAVIISEEEKDYREGLQWKLKFIYNKKEINLIYYHELNFFDTWPEEIQNIKHVMGMGAFLWNTEMDETNEIETILSYLKERTVLPFYLYGQTYFHRHFDTFVHIDQDFEREDIAIQEITNYSEFMDHVTPDLYYYTTSDEDASSTD